MLNEAIANGVVPRALAVINPGNPTGNSLPLENMKAVVRFCSKHNLVLMADEVYQENIYDSALPFHSFKKVSSPRGTIALSGDACTPPTFLFARTRDFL